MISSSKWAKHFWRQNKQRYCLTCSVGGEIVSSCSRKDGKRSKSVLKLMVAIIFLGSIRINAKAFLELLEIKPRTNSYKWILNEYRDMLNLITYMPKVKNPFSVYSMHCFLCRLNSECARSVYRTELSCCVWKPKINYLAV